MAIGASDGHSVWTSFRGEDARLSARRRARREFLAALRAAGVLSHGDEDRCPFPCAKLCGGCGQLRWAHDPTAGDPHRRGAEDSNPPCSHCRQASWIDLAHDPTFSTLVDTEAYDDRARRRLFARFGYSAGVLAITVPVVAIAGGAIVAGVIAGVGLASVGIASKRSGVSLRRRTLPRRWSMVLPPRGRTRPLAIGEVSTEERLIAPLTGRECVAYEVGVRENGRARGKLSSWVLLEQRNVALAIGDAHVGSDAVYLELPRTKQEQADAGRYLRARGVDACDPDLVVFETIVEPGAVASLHSDGTTVTLARSPA